MMRHGLAAGNNFVLILFVAVWLHVKTVEHSVEAVESQLVCAKWSEGFEHVFSNTRLIPRIDFRIRWVSLPSANLALRGGYEGETQRTGERERGPRKRKRKPKTPFKVANDEDGERRKQLPISLRGKKIHGQTPRTQADGADFPDRDRTRREVPNEILQGRGDSKRWLEKREKERKKAKETRFVANRKRQKALKEYREHGEHPAQQLLGPTPPEGPQSVLTIAGIPIQETFSPEQRFVPPEPTRPQSNATEPEEEKAEAEKQQVVGKDVAPRVGLRVGEREDGKEKSISERVVKGTSRSGLRGTVTRLYENEETCQVLWDDGTLANHSVAEGGGTLDLVCWDDSGPPPSKPQRSGGLGSLSPAVVKPAKKRKSLNDLYLEKKAEKDAAWAAKKERRERIEREREEAKVARQKWRKKLTAKTRRGQPVMKHQMHRLLIQMQKHQRAEEEEAAAVARGKGGAEVPA